MKFTSSLATGVSGRIGNMVGLMGRAGMLLRQWVQPSNPRTVAQDGVRATLSALAAAWSGTLTADQRQGWRDYAATLSFVNKLGVAYTISGFDAYVRSNGARMVAGLSRIDTAPVIGGDAGFTSPVPTFVASTDKVSVAFTNTDEWAGEVGGAMTVRACPLGFAPGIAFYEGPFIYAGKVVGAGTPPTSPVLIDMPSGVDAGVQYAIAVRVVRADGRCSAERIFRGVGA